jgi:hypothetical protein
MLRQPRVPAGYALGDVYSPAQIMHSVLTRPGVFAVFSIQILKLIITTESCLFPNLFDEKYGEYF